MPMGAFDAMVETLTAEASASSVPMAAQDNGQRIAALARFVADVRAGRMPAADVQNLLADALEAWMVDGVPLEHALGFQVRRGRKDQTARALYRKAQSAGVVALSGNADFRQPAAVAAISGAWRT